MAAVQDFLGLGTTLVMFCVVVASAVKLFQIANDIRESKDILKDFCRKAQSPVSAVSPISPLSPIVPVQSSVPALAEAVSGYAPSSSSLSAEELVRSVHAQSFKGEDFPI